MPTSTKAQKRAPQTCTINLRPRTESRLRSPGARKSHGPWERTVSNLSRKRRHLTNPLKDRAATSDTIRHQQMFKRSGKAICALLAAIVLSLPVSAQENFVPRNGYVPDETTAIAIARAVLIPIYGAKTIEDEEPLVAARDGTAWLVNGTVPCEHKSGRCFGNAVLVKLSASDGQIMFVTHGE
jgi:hypothetical protein